MDINWSNISSDYIRGNYVIVKKDILLRDISNYVNGAGAVLPGLEYFSGVIKAATLAEMGQILAVSAGVNFLLNTTGNPDLKVDIYLPWLPIFGPPYLIVPSESNFNGSSAYQNIDIGNQVTQQVNLHEEKKFKFKMEAGKRYVISLKNNYGDADLFSSNQVNFNRNNSQGSSSKSGQEVDKIEFVAPYSGDNYIIVFGFSASSFNLNIDEIWYWWR